MANLVALERASVVFGTVSVLDELSMGVNTGQRIGVVGRNGGGKSTLLRVIAGEQALDSGRVTRGGGISVAMLSQVDVLDPALTVHEAVLGDLPEHVWAGDPRIRDVLTGLLGGIAAEAVGGLDAVIGPMSGGERRRLALARLLVADPDILLLDEPTNHLDVEGVAWLADHIVTRRTRADSATVAITHDRWFLDAMATLTWEVVGGTVNTFEGGYAAYVLAKAERERMASVTAERRDNLLRKELAWLRRGPPARTTKPRFRIDAANELIADEPPPRDDVSLVRFATTRLGKDVLDLVDASVQLGGRLLLDRVTWRLAPGERVGIVGVNGSGKSTLLRAFTGDVGLSSGKRKVGSTVSVAFLTQEVRESRSSRRGGSSRRSRTSGSSPCWGTRRSAPASWPNAWASPVVASRPGWVTSPAESVAGCSCFGCSWPSPTSSSSTSRRTTSTSRPSRRSRTSSTAGPARSSSSLTTATSSSGSPTGRWPCSATVVFATFPVASSSTFSSSPRPGGRAARGAPSRAGRRAPRRARRRPGKQAARAAPR